MRVKRWIGRRFSAVGLGTLLVAITVTVYAAGGSKRTSETCTNDGECSRGHCYTKKDGNKVCVDCSPDKISRTRELTEKYCKSGDYPRKCDNISRAEEAPENYFKIRIENGDKCVEIRKDENSSCWDGGDSGHREQVDDAERTRKNCYDELNTRNGSGGIYTCSESTYSSESSTVTSACQSWGKGCEEWAKDDKVANCRDIEEAMKKTDACVIAVERLDSDCLPRLSSFRETQYKSAKRAYDYCKEVLAYKNSYKYCK